MSTLNDISQLLGLIAFVSLIWLAVRAFRKRRVSWGLGILLIPLIPIAIYFAYFLSYGPSRYHLYLPWAAGLSTTIAATAYAVKFWPEVKKLFLVYITSCTLSTALGLYVFTAVGGWEAWEASQDVAEGIAMGNLTQQDALTFMRRGLDMTEKGGVDEKEQKELDFMRQFLSAFESGFTEESSREMEQKLKNLHNQPEPGGNLEKEADPSGNKRAQQEASSRPAAPPNASPRIARASIAGDTEEKPPAIKLIRFDGSGSGGNGSPANALAQAKEWIGYSVIVTPKKGVRQEAVLAGVSGKVLRFEKRRRTGTLSFSLKDQDIASIKVLD